MSDLNPEIIKESFELVRPIAFEFANEFYKVLFEKYPETKAFFENVANMEGQKRALAKALETAVDNLENPDELTSYLKALGARHINYGVEEAHYPIVGDALLSAMEIFFGDDWTEEVSAQWKKVYCIVAALMIAGAREKNQAA
jgi:hemoglobin-like flavoprotein